MTRYEIIEKIGKEFATANLEKDGEFSYQKELGIKITGNKFLDLRFYSEEDKVAVLVETKQKFKTTDYQQLFNYVELEKKIGTKNIVAILTDTGNENRIKVWKYTGDKKEELKHESKIRAFVEYITFFDISKINNKQKVMQATYDLNELLLGYVNENLRSQFVGTCLLALKNELTYHGLTTAQIRAGITGVLETLLNGDINKAAKLVILNKKVLDEQEIRELKDKVFQEILQFIESNIMPYIDERTNQGQDLLNLFFTTFNKYVGKKDKNQAFTPDHIVHFMCKVAEVNKTSIVLDPTCGSGAFLVQAMTQALNGCATEEEKLKVKKEQIFGIEKEEKAFGLSVTNMLIHGDGNSNVQDGSCFARFKYLKDKNINLVLMNPPYNATIKDVPAEFSKTWGTKIKKKTEDKDEETVKNQKKKLDPTKGFYFVYETAKMINKDGKLLCLLPLSCAIGSDSEIAKYKRKMLAEHTLEAVFTLPSDMFHPGASASACCMVFTVGTPHQPDHDTFFGYYKNDGFTKKKNLGRVDIKNQWNTIEKEWLHLYNKKIEKPGMSVNHNIVPEDNIEVYNKEWLAEAYMKTDYSNISDKIFENTIRNYLAYLIPTNYDLYKKIKKQSPSQRQILDLKSRNWQEFQIDSLFSIEGTTTTRLDNLKENHGIGNYPYVTTQSVNNGVAGFYDYKTETGNVLVVDSAVVGYCTYQETDFTGSDHTEKLIPICEKISNFDKYIGLFIATLINQDNYRYSYGRKFNQGNIRNTKIILPALPNPDFDINSKNNKNEFIPDTEWIKNYMQSLPYGDLI